MVAKIHYRTSQMIGKKSNQILMVDIHGHVSMLAYVQFMLDVAKTKRNEEFTFLFQI